MIMKSNIRQLRKQRNISQKVLGEDIGLSQQVISRMERDRSKIQVDVLLNLADYFHVSTDCVLGYRMDGEANNPMEEALMLQSAANQELLAVIDDLEQMDWAKRQKLWRILAVLKRCL